MKKYFKSRFVFQQRRRRNRAIHWYKGRVKRLYPTYSKHLSANLLPYNAGEVIIRHTNKEATE
jgi:hypothetical protein